MRTFRFTFLLCSSMHRSVLFMLRGYRGVHFISIVDVFVVGRIHNHKEVWCMALYMSVVLFGGCPAYIRAHTLAWSSIFFFHSPRFRCAWCTEKKRKRRPENVVERMKKRKAKSTLNREIKMRRREQQIKMNWSAEETLLQSQWLCQRS